MQSSFNIPKTIPSQMQFERMLQAGKLDDAELFRNNHLPDMAYSPSMLLAAVDGGNMVSVKYVENLSRRIPAAPVPRYMTSYPRGGYSLREKLLMLKQLRKTIGVPYLVPPGETDPEDEDITDVPSELFLNIGLWYRDCPSFEVIEHLATAGAPIDTIRPSIFSKPDAVAICKYFYRKIPCIFNASNETIDRDFFMTKMFIAAVRSDNAEVVRWCLNLRIDTTDTWLHRDVITQAIYSTDAVNSLMAIEAHTPNFPYVRKHEKLIGEFDAVNVFDYYANVKGRVFDTRSLKTIFAGACIPHCSSLGNMYFKLANEYGMRPSNELLGRIISECMCENILYHLLHTLGLRPKKLKHQNQRPGKIYLNNCYLSVLYTGQRLVFDVAWRECPEIFSDAEIIRVVREYYFHEVEFDIEIMEVLLDHIKQIDPARAERLRSTIEDLAAARST